MKENKYLHLKYAVVSVNLSKIPVYTPAKADFSGAATYDANSRATGLPRTGG
jgi:hypothetical protein